MKKYVLLLLLSSSLLAENFAFNSPFLADSIRSDIEKLLNYEEISQLISNKGERAIFYQSVAFSIYQETLEFELKTKNIVGQYAELINSLEKRLGLKETVISYKLSAPIIDTHFTQRSVSRKTVKNKFHYNELESIKNQYLKLVRYHNNIINICEKRINELLELLDRDSIDKFYNDTVLEKNILVMNFTNISNIDKYDNLSKIFPDMIINRYKDRDDISVMYSGFVDPDLKEGNASLNDRLLIDGAFSIDGYNININYKIYNINNWSLYSNQNISCDVRDTECVYDHFLWHFDKTIDPLIKNYTYDDFSDNDKKTILDKNIENLSKNRKSDDLFKVVLDDFVVQKDYSFNFNYKGMNMEANSSEFSQEFDLQNHPNSINSRKKTSENLIKIISDYLKNPYDIQIGEINMKFNKNDNAYVDLWVPITFDINENKFEKLIKDFPYNTLNSRKKMNIYEFLYESYIFDSSVIQSFNDYENEIFPVLFFADREGNIQKIIIDSWDTKYDDLLFGDYDVLRLELFSQLFSVIESDNSMYLNIKEDSQTVHYKATMPVSLLDNYTRLTVKIFTRNELDQYLPVSQLKF